MNRRADNRIEMKLPAKLVFPQIWSNAVPCTTANLHRNGVLIACHFEASRVPLPSLGLRANLQIELPAHPVFTRRCIECDATLLRLRQTSAGEWHLALRIQNVSFGDYDCPETADLLDNAMPTRYVN